MKNSRNATTPTKGTRQYKHTPKTAKRLTSKIFALVACFVLLVTITIIPISASGWQENVDAVLVMHPYAPKSVTFASDYGLDYDISNTFPVGSPNNYTNSTTSFYIDGAYKTVSQQTKDNNDGTLSTFLTPNNTIYEEGDVNAFSVHWGAFAFSNLPVFAEYFNDRICVIEFTTPTYLKFSYQASYTDPTTLETETVTATSYTTELTTVGTGVPLSALVREFLVMKVPVDTCINYLDVVCVPVSTPNGDPNSNTTLERIVVRAPYMSDTTNPRTLVTFYETFVYPQDVDGRGLLSWLGDALGGLLNAPLVPLGDYTITIGGLLSAVLGISLLLVFLKIFMGG